MSKLIVIDSGNVMFKAIFAFRNTSVVPATYTYMRMILGYLKRIGTTVDDRVIIAVDYGSWRKKVDPNYKAQRKTLREGQEDKDFWDEMFKEFNEFIPKVEPCLPWYFIKIYDCEADDIASVCVRYFNNYDEKILVSSDKDWEMLCEIDKVKVFSTITKKYKIVPSPMKVLMEKIQGDKSDNLLEKPKNEVEFERRKLIVNLLELPNYIEEPIKKVLSSLTPKSVNWKKIPFRSLRIELEKLYKEINQIIF
jgi:hypothetical protein